MCKSHLRGLVFITLALTSLTAVAFGQSGAVAPEEPKEERLISQPGFTGTLNCTAFTWMQDCKKVNQWQKQNPEKPLRLIKDGFEFYFPPGTPSVDIDWVVNQTPESLERYMQYYERLGDRNKRSADMYGKALAARGGKFRGDKGLDYILDPPDTAVLEKVNDENIALYVFYDSKCGACASYETTLIALRKEFPNMAISLLMMDSDRKAASAISARTKIRANALSAEQKASYSKQVRVTPTTWIEDRRSKKTSVIEGAATWPELRRQLSRISK